MYSVPSRTGVNILPETCLELSKIENIVAIKEASGNISQVAKIASLCKENLAIYSGNDDQIVPVLSVGGLGVISVLSNVMPKYTHDMVMKYLDKQLYIFQTSTSDKQITTSMINKEEKIQNIFQMMKAWKYSIFSKIDVSCLK